MSEKREEPIEVSALSYRDAMAELEAILAQIEGEEVDLDALSERVARASSIIEHCRGQIAETELEVRAILEGLSEVPGAGE